MKDHKYRFMEVKEGKRTQLMVTINGQCRLLTDWAKEFGITKGALHYRLTHGWSPDLLASKPTQGKHPDKQYSLSHQYKLKKEASERTHTSYCQSAINAIFAPCVNRSRSISG